MTDLAGVAKHAGLDLDLHLPSRRSEILKALQAAYCAGIRDAMGECEAVSKGVIYNEDAIGAVSECYHGIKSLLSANVSG